MQTNFEVIGWGPAPSRPLGADVLSAFSRLTPETLWSDWKRSGEQWKVKERSPDRKRTLYFLGSISQAKLCDGADKGARGEKGRGARGLCRVEHNGIVNWVKPDSVVNHLTLFSLSFCGASFVQHVAHCGRASAALLLFWLMCFFSFLSGKNKTNPLKNKDEKFGFLTFFFFFWQLCLTFACVRGLK